MPRVVLVYPEFRTPTFWSFREALKIINKRANMPPYGLITIAGMLPKNFDLELIDENVRKLSDADLLRADLVMASAMIVQKESLAELIARCKRLGKPIVVGGPLVNTGFEEVAGADHYFIGEAEQGLAAFVADWLQGKAKKAYGHVIDETKAARIRTHFKNDVTLIVGERPSMAEMPMPRFDLLEYKLYGSMAVQFSRGCPVGCEFCDIWTQYGKRPRTKPVARLIAELDALLALGYQGPVFIVDDNFIGNKKLVKGELLPALLAWQEQHKFPFRFFTEATITLADDDELLSLMSRSGFDMVFCGIETPDEKSLLETHKALNTDYKTHNTVAKLLGQIDKVQRAGIEVCTGLIVGFDNEPANIDFVMSEFIQRANIPIAMAGLLTALPETELEKRLVREGRLRQKSAGNNTHGFEVNYETRRPEADVVASYKRLLDSLYDRRLKRYFERCEGLLDRIAARPKTRRAVRFEDLRTLARSIYTLVPTAYGWNYVKYLVKRFVKNRETFADAVALAVKGHHLAHITRTAIETHEVHSHCAEVLRQLDEYLVSVQASYRHGKVRLEEAYARRTLALKEVQRRIKKLQHSSRDAARQHYEHFAGQVKERFARFEALMGRAEFGR